jgi:hypothetical protein
MLKEIQIPHYAPMIRVNPCGFASAQMTFRAVTLIGFDKEQGGFSLRWKILREYYGFAKFKKRIYI